MNRTTKPKLTSAQLVSKLEAKGVTFKYLSKHEAELFLQKRNNFLRVASYRKNYQKYQSGRNEGKYENLDFSYLQEISVIDTLLRYIILQMCLDIEHSLKVKILYDIENDPNEDGYQVVNDFLNNNPRVVNSIEGTSASPFTRDLIDKYFTVSKIISNGKIIHKITSYDCSAWVLLEMLTFGDFIRFYEFYYHRTNKSTVPLSLISLTKSMRNACAHNNCILADLSKGISKNTAYVSQRVARIPDITKSQRQKKMTSRAVLEFVGLLCLYDIVVSGKIREHRIHDLKILFSKRMVEKKEYFSQNNLLVSTYEFVCKVLENLFDDIEPHV